MAADEYNDHGEQEYDSEEENYTRDDDSTIWDLTGIYHAEEEQGDQLPESVPVERRKNNSDRRSGDFTDRRRGDRRKRRISRSAG